ncbi:Serine/threonine protein kinase with PASTA sensor(S) (fragment) [Candidatus Promineifilum breve]|uniref:non-specific serine/threonine protein kinase n=2 Tax=Candidatus Promineifilum breve TaxID=1806508 RepID=A0A160SXR2_9CHLR
MTPGLTFLAVVPSPLYNLPYSMADEQIVFNGRYRVLDRIGSGGMSVVYRAQDLSLGRIVAVKVLHENLTDDEGFLRRFQREAHAVANLSHPNIVTVHDIGEDNNRHYIVMEFVDGRTLKQLVRLQNQQGRPLIISQALDLGIQICAGIGYAHRANLIHCDVKSQNMLITRDERVKVADFGIARAMSEATQHTLDGQIWGTPHYFSPEQAAGQAASPASDVYAIGVVLFELLTGRLPFLADTPTALALKHMQEPPPRASEFNPLVPHQLDQILLKVLSKEPAARYRTGDQLGRILSAYRESSLQATAPISLLDLEMPAYELSTAVYPRPTDNDPAYLPTDEIIIHGGEGRPGAARPSRETVQPTTAAPTTGRDWAAIALGILAVAALLGLIPLWYFVFLAYSG